MDRYGPGASFWFPRRKVSNAQRVVAGAGDRVATRPEADRRRLALGEGQRVLVRITRITLSGTPRFMSLHATSFWYCMYVISPRFFGRPCRPEKQNANPIVRRFMGLRSS